MLPACAGVIPFTGVSIPGKVDAPRMRGGDPEYPDIYEQFVRCSPHARG